MSTDIEVLEAAVKHCQQQLRDAQTALTEARKAAAKYQPGDIVEIWWKGAWVPAIVRTLEVGYGTVDCNVSVANKDGTWGKGTRRVWGSMIRTNSERNTP